MESKFNKIHYLIVFFFFLHTLVANGQWTGQVVDAKTKELLPFVNISFNNEATLGTSTDLNGIFEISAEQNVRQLAFSYVGYQPLSVSVDTIDLTQPVVIFGLESSSVSLEEVVILPGENPADIIIRKVFENRETNDPEINLNSFAYNSYSKTTYDLVPEPIEEARKFRGRKDSIRYNKINQKAQEIAESRHVLMSETVSERQFMAPDKRVEKVLANKVSGLQNPAFALVPARFKHFSIYTDFIRLIDTDYLNPISKNSEKRYFFNLEDTLYTETQDTIFILSFLPKRGKNINGLKGKVYINTDGYAVQNLLAEPADQSLVYARVNQKSTKIDGKQWFPSEIGFEVIMDEVPQLGLGMKVVAKTWITEVELNAAVEEEAFGIETFVLDEKMNEQSEDYWNQNRKDTLNTKELETYRSMEATRKKYKLDYWGIALPKLESGYLYADKVDIDLDKLFRTNDVEGIRLGMGLQTNEYVSERFRVGGFFGYGFKDKAWKYGAHVGIKPNPKKETELELRYLYDLEQAGLTTLSYSGNILNVRDYVVANFDFTELKEAALTFRMLQYVKVRLRVNQIEKTPTYGYKFTSFQSDDSPQVFNFAEVGVQLRYAHKEKFVQSFGRSISTGTKFPVLYAAYTKGLDNWLGGAFAYDKLELGVTSSFKTRNFGKTKLHVEGGSVWGDVPYSRLFLGSGNYSPTIPFYVSNTFQTMRLFEFLSDDYLNFFFSHNFETRLFRSPRFRPDVYVIHNMGFGKLKDPEAHQIEANSSFKTLEKGYYESGILMDGLVQFNYFNIVYIGLGGGVFYRYGPYQYNKSWNNVALKAILRIKVN